MSSIYLSNAIYDDNIDDHLFKDPVLYYMEPE